jgi:hypothetical protein
MIMRILQSRWFCGACLFLTSTIVEAAPVLAFLSTWGSTIAAGMAAVSAISQANQQKQAAKYNEKVAENQAIASRQEAAANADIQRRKAAKTIGGIEATYGASGVTLEGSPLEILEESVRNAELDRQTILWSGESRATGYSNTARLENSRASNAMASGMLSAAGSAVRGYAEYGKAISLQRTE